MTLAILLMAHFVADFLLQTREMGKRKSEDLAVLLEHCMIQFGTILFIGLCLSLPGHAIVMISLINAIIHGIIDWHIWRLYKYSVLVRVKNQLRPQEFHTYKKKLQQYRYWEDGWFYSTIGLDQLLHTLTLIWLVEKFL